MPEVYENYMVFQNVLENQDYFSHGDDLQAISSQGVYSPFNGSQGTASIASPMSASSAIHVIGEPHITILNEPMDKFRFRYRSEMLGTHGSLVATNCSGRKKNAPSVKLHNYLDNAIIRCTLVTSDDGQRIPHAHRLVRRQDGIDSDDPHHIKVSSENGFVATFYGMGIIHTAKKHVRDELIRKMRSKALEEKKWENINATLTTREEAQIKADAEYYQKCVNLNSVALCFQAFILDKHDIMRPITAPVYSKAINNLKSALTGELKICRIDKHTSSVDGNEEVFIFVEKVGKKNIKIKFFELNEDDTEIWRDYGRFSELDVHHQYAIAFRTPQYRDLNIVSPVEVFIQLERPSNGDCSEPKRFTYKPSDRVIGRKRQRMSCSGSTELSRIMPPFNDVEIESNLGDSREISKELKKMIMEGCSSPDHREFIETIDLDKYLRCIDGSEDNMLTADGPLLRQHQDDSLFPKHILIEVVRHMKMDSRNTNEYVQKLLKDRSTYGDSPLHAALRYGQRDIVKYILMLISTDKDCKMLVNGQNSSGKTPLHYAVLQNQPEITKALLELGADPNRSDEHGCSPLHAAVRVPRAGACVGALLADKVVDIEAHNDAGWTPLHLAAEAGSYEAVCLLVQAGANVNNTDMSYGRTVLHIAVEGGHKDIVEYLLKQTDISVNKRNFSGNTALHTAVVYSGVRAKELCALLIQYGADPHIQNHNRESNSVDKRKGSHTDIKVEVDSDTENENTEESAGQSSFDLATNKPDILQLLNGQAKEITPDVGPVSTKVEAEDEDSNINWLNSERKEKLSIFLDKTQGWKKLAKHLNFQYFLNTLQQSASSPSLLLLNYIDVQASLSLTDMETVLRDIGEIEAADYVKEISSTCSQNSFPYC
ncbi:nuclear factor NF-kappa-B p100 subunit isoform X1 [Hylaeus volcanicus]|uniref:nuclear factor NF-kappa-B p100 subunit isoform X1 n=1 Tax=Hylaeus volcanicus TaxID=313075 RepID=UPI0023B856C1|nr:nuclear factor NF-kappa-B p100 subunit isoform X1 [Hylaeus volcanicus]XP_053994188.1 nuclear factor NF-kappa-B p100 subunit isoform X1 [Hylaeus volcanicus]XP_053994189.1 nuclear factor NF-kappa-B p100 subunit isoform X1 [Hylaeus volcanicus]